MTYYKIENNVLELGSGSFIAGGYIEYETGNEPNELVEALKLNKNNINVQLINNKANEIIISKYPLYMQNNIALLLSPYTELDLEEMKIFIEIIRNIAKTSKENGTPYEDIDWVGLD